MNARTRVRRVLASDGHLIKTVRLRSLTADATSFGSTHERENAFPDDEWNDWAVGDSAGQEMATFLAMRGAEPVGMVAAYRDEHEQRMFHVIAMWVAPEAPREGIARRLLNDIEEWIASCGGSCVQLSVADVAHAATRLYEAAGYRPDGEVSDSPHTPGITHISLRRSLPSER